MQIEGLCTAKVPDGSTDDLWRNTCCTSSPQIYTLMGFLLVTAEPSSGQRAGLSFIEGQVFLSLQVCTERVREKRERNCPNIPIRFMAKEEFEL